MVAANADIDPLENGYTLVAAVVMSIGCRVWGGRLEAVRRRLVPRRGAVEGVRRAGRAGVRRMVPRAFAAALWPPWICST